MLIATPPATQFRMEIGRVTDDPMSDPTLTMQMDVDFTKAEPNGTLTVRTMVGDRPEVNVLTAKDTETTRWIYGALRDAVAGVDFVQHGTPADGSPVRDATMRWTTTDAAGAARSITIDENTTDFAGANELNAAATQFLYGSFGLFDD